MILAEFNVVNTPYEMDAKGYCLTECPFHRMSNDVPVMVGSWACSECDRFFNKNDEYVVCRKS